MRIFTRKKDEIKEWKVEKVGNTWYRVNLKTGEYTSIEGRSEFDRLLNIVKEKKMSTTKAKQLFKQNKIQLSKREVNEIIKPTTRKHGRRH